MGMATCPAAARKLAEMTADDLDTYLDTLTPGGQTYHDIGMIWGGRLISPTGLFAGENADVGARPADRAQPDLPHRRRNRPARPRLFELRSRTARPAPLERELAAAPCTQTVEKRFSFACDEVKKRNVTVWVVTFGTSLNPMLQECAGEGHFFEAARFRGTRQGVRPDRQADGRVEDRQVIGCRCACSATRRGATLVEVRAGRPGAADDADGHLRPRLQHLRRRSCSKARSRRPPGIRRSRAPMRRSTVIDARGDPRGPPRSRRTRELTFARKAYANFSDVSRARGFHRRRQERQPATTASRSRTSTATASWDTDRGMDGHGQRARRGALYRHRGSAAAVPGRRADRPARIPSRPRRKPCCATSRSRRRKSAKRW